MGQVKNHWARLGSANAWYFLAQAKLGPGLGLKHRLVQSSYAEAVWKRKVVQENIDVLVDIHNFHDVHHRRASSTLLFLFLLLLEGHSAYQAFQVQHYSEECNTRNEVM